MGGLPPVAIVAIAAQTLHGRERMVVVLGEEWVEMVMICATATTAVGGGCAARGRMQQMIVIDAL